MPIPLLEELYAEVRRLTIAGSVVAPGDFRLQRLIEPLRKLGERAPVFLRLADGVEQVVTATEKTADEALLELAALVHAILSTQGDTGAEGELEPIPSNPLELRQSTASSQTIKSIRHMLSVSRHGRLEELRAAYKQGFFRDLRLVQPALDALDDSTREVREFIAENVLPEFGPGIVPELKRRLNLEGKGGDAMRLKLLHRLAANDSRALVLQALESGSKEVKIAAVECLGGEADDLQVLLDQSRARSKDMRRAAYLALARWATPGAMERLEQALDSADLELLVEVTDLAAPADIVLGALNRARSILDEARQAIAERKEKSAAIPRLLPLLQIGFRSQPHERNRFLLEQFDDLAALQQVTASDKSFEVLDFLLTQAKTSNRDVVERLIEQREQLMINRWRLLIAAARCQIPSDRYFDIFSPYVTKQEDATVATSSRSRWIVDDLTEDRPFLDSRQQTNPPTTAKQPPDPRWLDLGIDLDLIDLVCTLAHLPNPRTHDYLDQKWIVDDFPKNNHLPYIGLAMLSAGHPEAITRILTFIESQVEKAHRWQSPVVWGRLAALLPLETVEQLERFVADPRIGFRWKEALVDAIVAIRLNHGKSSASGGGANSAPTSENSTSS